jgi:hypothetical protein
MKTLSLLLLLCTALALTVEINNIHNGYRNIYQGSFSVEGSQISLTSYVLIALADFSQA